VSKLDWLDLLLILTSLVVLGGLMLLISFVAYDAIGEILDIIWGGNASGGNAESPLLALLLLRMAIRRMFW
jgi:hypothetical protein